MGWTCLHCGLFNVETAERCECKGKRGTKPRTPEPEKPGFIEAWFERNSGWLWKITAAGVAIYFGWPIAMSRLEMYICKQNAQSDMDEYAGPTRDPAVQKCTGTLDRATCIVRLLREGSYVTGAVTLSCKARHFEPGMRERFLNTPVEGNAWLDRASKFIQHAEFGRELGLP